MAAAQGFEMVVAGGVAGAGALPHYVLPPSQLPFCAPPGAVARWPHAPLPDNRAGVAEIAVWEGAWRHNGRPIMQ